MIGIYKIESPTGKVYIGQSINILNRIKRYKQLTCKNQNRLYHSLKKYGFDAHKFEIIEECLEELLNIRERYWQEFYDVLNKHKGLNCNYTNTNEKPKRHSKETIEKIVNSNKGKKRSEEYRIKMSETMKGKLSGEKHPQFGKKLSLERIEKLRISSTGNKNMLGKRHSEETKRILSIKCSLHRHTEDTKNRISKALIGRPVSEETRAKISVSNKGRKASDETRKNISKALTGRKLSHECLTKRSITINSKPHHQGRLVINLETGIFYDSIKEASDAYGINRATIQNGLSRNKKKSKIVYA